jgi:hypothetical protein
MSVLDNMIQDAPDQIDAIDSSLGQIDDQIADLTTQIDGVTSELCDTAKDDLTTYLQDVKLPTIPDGVTVVPGTGTIAWGSVGISDFQILDATNVPVYSMTVNWDSDATIQKYVDDFAFGNDYLTRPLITGATYGLIPSRSALESAKTLLEENKAAIEESLVVFEDYK